MSIYQKYYNHGFALLQSFREAGIKEVGTDEWYKNMLDPLSYEFWKQWEPEYDDVSDDYINSLSSEQRDRHIDLVMKRIKYGVWKKTPGYELLPEKMRNEYEKKYPAAGWVQLLPGYHYFLLNFIKVDAKGYGIITPRYYRRDSVCFSQMEILERYQLGDLDNRAGFLTFKTRGSHHTTALMTCALANMLTKKAYTHGIAMDIGKKISDQSTKFEMYLGYLPAWIRPVSVRDETDQRELKSIKKNVVSYRRNDQKFECYIKFWDKKEKRFDPMRNVLYILNHDSKSWEGKRFDRLDIDEAGICQYDLRHLIERVRPCLYNDSNQIVGLLSVGGTSDENNVNNNHFLRSLKDDPESGDFFIYFCGRQHVMGVDKFGKTDELRIVELENKKRSQYLENGNFAGYISHICSNPIQVDDCLYIQGTTYVDIERINKQIILLRDAKMDPTHKDHFIEHRGWLKMTGNIFSPEFSPDLAKGGWHIVEFPPDTTNRNGKIGNLYFAGSDNVNKVISQEQEQLVNAGRSTLSRQSIIIINATTMKIAAYYLYRHSDPKEDYLQSLLGCMYYNCYIYPEENKEQQIQFFKDYSWGAFKKGYFSRYLYRRPEAFGGNWRTARYADTILYGHITGPAKIAHYEDYVIPYLDKYTEQIMFPEILETLIKWNITDRKDSPDLGMAFLVTLAGLDDFHKNIKTPVNSRGVGILEAYKAINRNGFG